MKPRALLERMARLFSRREKEEEADLEAIAAREQLALRYETLAAATRGFSEENRLGQGGFGPVYRGRLEDGRDVAVKRLGGGSRQGAREFRNEATQLSRVQHRNVVHLIGYCARGAEDKLLVYEYVPNESLDKILFSPSSSSAHSSSNSDRSRRAELTWPRRHEVVVGVAGGLLYLHEESRTPIIHRDIKAGNILLDDRWVPKIADFGMARLFPEAGDGHRPVHSRVAGTNGYMAPEYLMHGHLSIKVDVFSFGVVVLEIVSGRKTSAFIPPLDAEADSLLEYAWRLYKKGRSLELLDPAVKSSAVPEQVELCVRIGLLCVQADPRLRPDMKRVVIILSKKQSTLEEPTRPGVPGSHLRMQMGRPTFGSSTTTTSGTRTTMTLSSALSEPVRDEEEESAMDVVKTWRHMRGLVEEFRAGADGNATAPDRWLSELHVAWLLRLAELDASGSGQSTFISRSRQLQSPAQTWIPALQMISTSVWKCLNVLYSDGEATVGPPATEFAQFLKATLLKMLTFVDAIVALDPLNFDDASATSQQHVPSSSSSVMGAVEKVRALLDVRHALSAASEQMMMAFCSSPYVQSTQVADDMEGLLSAQLGKLDQAVWDTFDHIRTAVVTPSLDDDDNSSAAEGPRGATQTTTLLQSSPAIHKVTRSVINYINIVLSTEALLSANYARLHGDTSSLTILTMEVVGSLEEELARVSQSFTDQSLRFIFLINNSYLIRQLLDTSWPPHLHDLTYLRFLNSLTNRIDRYIQSYLQVSWAPVLKCLHNPTFRCFTRDLPLPKFESKFQSTYAAQKLWKVPDPDMRKRLREAVIEKVVSGFTEYLEDSNRIIPGVSPPEVEEMLQELFEG